MTWLMLKKTAVKNYPLLYRRRFQTILLVKVTTGGCNLNIFPTLIFKFKEENVYRYAKDSQITIRLAKRDEDLSQIDIDNLRKECDKLGPIKYTYGTVRSHYINPQKRFKTTLFSESKEQAEFVFNKVLGVINESFDKKDLSHTTDIKRENNTKRSKELDNIGLNKYNYKTSILKTL